MQTIPPVTPAPKTWKPTVAGVLDIVSGSMSLIGVLFLIFFAILIGSNPDWMGITETDFDPFTVGQVSAFMLVGAAFLAVIGVLALVGGIYATRRKKWGLALAGSIAAAVGSTVVGVLAIIFVAMGKDEFV